MISKEFPQFSPEVYRHIALNDLVTYAVYFVGGRVAGDIVAEDIVAACYKLFPERFHLRGYPDWPDSTVVNKRWIDCRAKGLLRGSTATGFSVTPKGLALAEKIEAVLAGKKRQFIRNHKNKVSGETRTRAGRFIRALEQSDAFRQFSSEDNQRQISEFDFRNMLLCTMESSPSTLRSNLEQFTQSAALYERSDLLKFLDYCRGKFANLLTESSPKRQRYRGGMLKQKIGGTNDSRNK
jgi:hypothetical protein